MKKCLKIVAVWLGNKRDLNGNRSTVDLIDDLIDNEINIENGIPTDVCLTIQKTGYELTDNSLDYLNNTKTNNGKIFIEKRENTALSFGAYLWTYDKYQEDYDYFWFQEDDYIMFRDNIIKKFAEELDRDTTCSFIGLLPIIPDKYTGLTNHPSVNRLATHRHAPGGMGLASRRALKLSYPNPKSRLKKWVKENGYGNTIPNTPEEAKKWSGKANTEMTEFAKEQNANYIKRGLGQYNINHEIEFTAAMCHTGMTIKNYPHTYSNLGKNWRVHTSLVDRAGKGQIDLGEENKETIYYGGKNDYEFIKKLRNQMREENGSF